VVCVVTSSKKISKILKDLQASTPDIEASALVSTDGAIIASELPPEIEEAEISAVTIAMVFLGEKSTKNLAGGELKQIYIKGENGHILLTVVGKKAMIIGKVRENAKMRSVFLNLRKTEGKLAEITKRETLCEKHDFLDEYHSNKKTKKLDRDAILKKYKIKIPPDEMILKILENSGINYKNIHKSKQ